MSEFDGDFTVIPEYKVLLIDDDKTYAQLVRRVLKSCRTSRFDFEWTPDFQTAVDSLEADAHDAYLIDYKLADHDGLELLKVGSRRNCRGAMILLTGAGDSSVDQKALELGAVEYMEKHRADGPMLERSIRYAVQWKRKEEELRAANEQLKAHQMQLIQAEKMNSVGRLAAGIAHEIKNPLAIISMGLDFFRNKSAKDEGMKLAVDEMDDAVTRADRIVKGLLDFSAPLELKQRAEDLHAVLSKALMFVRHELHIRHIKVKRELAPKLPLCHVDANKFIQVFINIFLNAAYAMPNGGVLTVRTKVRSLDEVFTGLTEDSAEEVGKVITVEIEDTGVGIPEDKLDKIYDPFFTTKPTGVGTGLGLAVAKSIMLLHGGGLDVENKENGGGVRVTLSILV
ncbi:MAG: response regulator [Verrucomicrobia bacterium]|nr:response regulator [Verrucomicrobiota bacterium]